MTRREQIRMARAALNWGVRDLAGRAGVAPNTISRFENGAGIWAETLDKMIKAFETEGIDFPDEATVSIRRLIDRGRTQR